MFEQSRALLRDHAGLIAAGFMLYFFSAFGQSVMIGIYLPNLQEDLGLTKTAIGSLYALATIASAFAIIFSGKLLDFWPLQRFVALVFAGLAAGCFIFAHVYNVAALFLAFFMLRHFGQGLTALAASTSLNRYIEQGKGKAVALAALGGSIHVIVFPLIALSLEEHIHWRTIWDFYGLFNLLVLLPGFWLFLRAHQNSTHAKWEEKTKAASAMALGAALEDEWTRRHVLGDWRFYGLVAITIIPPYVGTAILFYQREVAEALGLSALQFASSFPFLTGASVFAALAAGYLIDRYSEKPVLVAFPLIVTLGLFLLTNAHSGLVAAFAGMALIGAANGMLSTVGGPLLAHLYGTKHLGSIKALLFATTIVSSALSPFTFGFLMDRGYAITTQLSWIIYYSSVVWVFAFPICKKLKPQRGTAA